MNDQPNPYTAKIAELERELAEYKERDTILVDAMGEIMATVYRKSDQLIEDIVAGCISELQCIGKYKSNLYEKQRSSPCSCNRSP